MKLQLYIFLFALTLSTASKAQDTIQIKAERNAVKQFYTLQSCETDRNLADSQNAVLRSDNAIWRAKYESKSNLADSTAYLLNNSIRDGLNMEANCKRSLANKARAEKIKDAVLYILIPVVIAETTYLFIRK